MFRFSLLIFLLSVGCQSVQQRNLALIQDRSTKLQPLTRWSPTWCQVDVELTEPAAARYREMFPDDAVVSGKGAESATSRTLAYTWKARKSACEITALDSGPVAKSQKSFVETALCLLAQVYWVNSPFEDLRVLPADVIDAPAEVQVRQSDNKDLGVFLNKEKFTVETRTKARGNLSARYVEVDKEWRLEAMEQQVGPTRIAVDEITLAAQRVGDSRPFESFWISAGTEKPFRQSKVRFHDCRAY